MPDKKAGQPLMMRRDYDAPEAMMVKPLSPPQYTPEEMIDEDASPMVPSNPKGFKLICPTCEEVGAYEPEEDVEEDSMVVCPKCASKVELKAFVKTASGEYRVKQASNLDPNFKALRDIIPRKPSEVTLSKSDVSKILKHLDRLEGVYSKFKEALKGK